jgi:hypothetical protein
MSVSAGIGRLLLQTSTALVARVGSTQTTAQQQRNTATHKQRFFDLMFQVFAPSQEAIHTQAIVASLLTQTSL